MRELGGWLSSRPLIPTGQLAISATSPSPCLPRSLYTVPRMQGHWSLALGHWSFARRAANRTSRCSITHHRLASDPPRPTAVGRTDDAGDSHDRRCRVCGGFGSRCQIPELHILGHATDVGIESSVVRCDESLLGTEFCWPGNPRWVSPGATPAWVANRRSANENRRLFLRAKRTRRKIRRLA